MARLGLSNKILYRGQGFKFCQKRITGTMFCFLFLPPPADPLLGVVAVSFMNPPADWLEFHMIWLLDFLSVRLGLKFLGLSSLGVDT